MQNSELESQIKHIVESCNCDLYDIEVLNENESKIFRISISSPNGITHDDCQKISEIVSPLLDVYNPIDSEYYLEVSSPGLERKLTKPNHFKLSINQRIKITLLDKTTHSGILMNADDKGFTLDDTYFAYGEIKKAKSVFDF